MVRFAITLAVLAAFGGLVWWGARAESRVECELCLEMGGRIECRAGRGADRETAVQSARTNVCAFLADGVTEAFACSSLPARSLTCRER